MNMRLDRKGNTSKDRRPARSASRRKVTKRGRSTNCITIDRTDDASVAAVLLDDLLRDGIKRFVEMVERHMQNPDENRRGWPRSISPCRNTTGQVMKAVEAAFELLGWLLDVELEHNDTCSLGALRQLAGPPLNIPGSSGWQLRRFEFPGHSEEGVCVLNAPSFSERRKKHAAESKDDNCSSAGGARPVARETGACNRKEPRR
jgi:hypothetical protein